MTSDDPRSSNDGGSWESPEGGYGEEYLLGAVLRVLGNYRRVLAISLLGVAVVVLFGGGWVYVSQPTEQHGNLEFRLIFDGAEKGRYPNALPFDSGEIIATPILTEVYEQNDLARYCSYELFRNGLFIFESSTELELLGYEYQAKLSNGTLSAVDRERLEGEFLGKRETLQRPQYSLSFVGPTGGMPITEVLLNKVLNDVLDVWADQAVTRKRVLEYETDLQSPNTFLEGHWDTDDEGAKNFVVEVDVLRSRVHRVLDALKELSRVPGARLIRSEEHPLSLPEVQANLEELLVFRLEPLAGDIWSLSLPEVRRSYADYRLFQVALDRSAAEGRAKLLEDALGIYLGDREERDFPTGFLGENGAAGMGSGQGVIPQLGDSFLDRIVAMAEDNTVDIEYRREIAEQIITAREELVTLDKEVGYYGQMSQGLSRPLSSRGPMISDPAVASSIGARLSEISGAVLSAVEQSNILSRELSSQNMNPGTGLFRITSPFITTSERAVSIGSILRYSLLYLMIGILLAPLLCLAHHYWHHR